MSNTMFIEAQSADPYVQQLARNAIRLLNDPTLDRWQRERHIRRLQKLLLEHQAKADAKAARVAEKQARKAEQSARGAGSGGASAIANVSQVAARRRELRGADRKGIEVEMSDKETTPKGPVEVKKVRLARRVNPALPLPVEVPRVDSANDANRELAKRA